MDIGAAEAALIGVAENLIQHGDAPGLERGWAIARLIALRKAEGRSVSQRAFARELGCSAGTLSYARRIGERFPRARIKSLAERLEVDLEALIPLDQSALIRIIDCRAPIEDGVLLEVAARSFLSGGRACRAGEEAISGPREPVIDVILQDDGRIVANVTRAISRIESLRFATRVWYPSRFRGA